MRFPALLLTLTLASSISAKPHNWKDAVVLSITSTNAGAAAMPIGAAIVAVPLSGRTYWIKSDGITYALQTDYTGHWPNLTIHGHAKIAVEGHTAHVLDEDNKDRKFKIIEKVAD